MYEVTAAGKPVGKVQLTRQGLYYRIHCRCAAEREKVYRLFAVFDDRRENLGVLVPGEDALLLDRKISVRQLGTGDVRFEISWGVRPGEGIFIPICPEEPFSYIEKLKDAFLDCRQGKVGVRIQETPGG